MQDLGTSDRTLPVTERPPHPAKASRLRAPAPPIYDLRTGGNSDTYFSGVAAILH